MVLQRGLLLFYFFSEDIFSRVVKAFVENLSRDIVIHQKSHVDGTLRGDFFPLSTVFPNVRKTAIELNKNDKMSRK